jgi:tetratricopeptide (TPR) repeat protein
MPGKILLIIIISAILPTAAAAAPLIRSDPHETELDYNQCKRIGEYFLRQEVYHKSAVYFRSALQLKPKSKAANDGYIRSLIELEDFDRAYEYLRPLLCADPGDYKYNLFMGEVLEGEYRIPGALYYYRRAARIIGGRSESSGPVARIKTAERLLEFPEHNSIDKDVYIRREENPFKDLIEETRIKIAVFPVKGADSKKSRNIVDLLNDMISGHDCCLAAESEALRREIIEQRLDIFDDINQITAMDLAASMGIDLIILCSLHKTRSHNIIRLELYDVRERTRSVEINRYVSGSKDISGLGESLISYLCSSMIASH